MPPPYSRYHNSFITSYLETGQSTIIGRENPQFGLHKSSYIFPIRLYVKELPSINQGSQFLGTIRPDKSGFGFCYIITNKNFIIEAISAGCIGILNLRKWITKRSFDLSELAPDIADSSKRNILMSFKGGTLQYNMPEWKQGEND